MDLDQEEEHWVDVDQREEVVDNDLNIFTVGRTATTPISVKLCIDTKPLEMEIDTGVVVSIVSEEQLCKRLPHRLDPVLLCCVLTWLRKYHYLGRHNYVLNTRDRGTHSLHTLPRGHGHACWDMIGYGKYTRTGK